ncbi:Leucine Rich Repeat family protein [Trichomonas vaginalis G3]|uniref:Leucine Rich Repeat family protein n=1 Tax=Trichomonas vaginalis (strain ATCC PRA-98 / G3) TaxID=412133 RepID=A2DGP2_TRIV3|nr:uncharacterized protein TVAGG3_0997640 [Trichomonas vaginalis G3]EAY20429.1 Leucine Rich Repeat family protein [Trichomonas vaginalis G3]KAI5490521.1 leucine-rich repeat, isoform f-related family [Trichomonas vaginalis G3]|eukprot:XP_001581415.1 hypothetical protein [Trichomonas vaginalis G3]
MVFNLSDAISASKAANRIPLCAASSVDQCEGEPQILHYVVTDITLDVYESETNKLRQSEYWINLIQIEYKLNQITLTFEKDELIINSSRAEIIFYAVGHIMKQISTKDQFDNFGFGQTKFSTVLNTNYAAVYRFTQHANLKKQEIPPKLLDKISKLAQYGETTLNLQDFMQYTEFLPNVFEILPLIRTLSTLKISNPRNIPNLETYFAYLSKIKRFEITGKSGNTIIPALSQFLSMKKLQIQSISLENTEMTLDEVKKFGKICKSLKITSLGLHNITEDSESSDYLVTKFLSPQLTKNLTVLDFSGTKKLDVSRVLPRIPSIFALNLSNIDTEISEIFELMSNSPLPHLKYLDISQNPSKKPISFISKLPQNLFSIFADFVNWENDTFLVFMQYMIGKNPIKGLKLSVSHANCENKIWQQIFSMMKETSTNNLSGLIWDNNPLSSSLFVFLQKQVLLSYLSLCFCFDEKCQNFVQNLANFVAISPSLLFLKIRGDKQQKVIGQNCGQLIRSVLKSNLIHFDISDNKISDTGIYNLQNLVCNNETLELLMFDGSSPSNVNSYLDLLRKCSQASSKLLISFPSDDLDSLYNWMKISKEEKSEIMNLYKQKVYLKEENSFPIPKDSPFMKPFNCFKYYYKSNFPQILSNEQIDLIKKVTQPNISIPEKIPEKKKIPITPHRASYYGESEKMMKLSLSDRRFAMTPQPSFKKKNPFVSSSSSNRFFDSPVAQSSDSSKQVSFKLNLSDSSKIEEQLYESNSVESKQSDVFDMVDQPEDNKEKKEEIEERIEIFRRSSFEETEQKCEETIAGRDENGNILPLRPKHRKRKSKNKVV